MLIDNINCKICEGYRGYEWSGRDGYLREVPKPTGAGNLIAASTGGTGTYTWFVAADGRVKSVPDKTAGVYP